MNADDTAVIADDARDAKRLLAAICARRAKWKSKFGIDGKVCIGGRDYPTLLDNDGCPTLTPNIRAALDAEDRLKP